MVLACSAAVGWIGLHRDPPARALEVLRVDVTVTSVPGLAANSGSRRELIPEFVPEGDELVLGQLRTDQFADVLTQILAAGRGRSVLFPTSSGAGWCARRRAAVPRRV
jgi:hypothetical protein